MSSNVGLAGPVNLWDPKILNAEIHRIAEGTAAYYTRDGSLSKILTTTLERELALLVGTLDRAASFAQPNVTIGMTKGSKPTLFGIIQARLGCIEIEASVRPILECAPSNGHKKTFWMPAIESPNAEEILGDFITKNGCLPSESQAKDLQRAIYANKGERSSSDRAR